jgi:hypothetical protein
VRVVFTPTVKHTGTWFLLRFLERAMTDASIVEVWWMLQEMHPISTPTILHTHFPAMDQLSEPIKKSLPVDAIHTLNRHPAARPSCRPVDQGVPRTNLRHFHIVDGFMEIAKCLLPAG